LFAIAATCLIKGFQSIESAGALWLLILGLFIKRRENESLFFSLSATLHSWVQYPLYKSTLSIDTIWSISFFDKAFCNSPFFTISFQLYLCVFNNIWSNSLKKTRKESVLCQIRLNRPTILSILSIFLKSPKAIFNCLKNSVEINNNIFL